MESVAEDNEPEVNLTESVIDQESDDENITDEIDEADFYEEKENDPGATKTRSNVWPHFTVIRNAAGKKYAKCKHCPNT